MNQTMNGLPKLHFVCNECGFECYTCGCPRSCPKCGFNPCDKKYDTKTPFLEIEIIPNEGNKQILIGLKKTGD